MYVIAVRHAASPSATVEGHPLPAPRCGGIDTRPLQATSFELCREAKSRYQVDSTCEPLRSRSCEPEGGLVEFQGANRVSTAQSQCLGPPWTIQRANVPISSWRRRWRKGGHLEDSKVDVQARSLVISSTRGDPGTTRPDQIPVKDKHQRAFASTSWRNGRQSQLRYNISTPSGAGRTTQESGWISLVEVVEDTELQGMGFEPCGVVETPYHTPSRRYALSGPKPVS